MQDYNDFLKAKKKAMSEPVVNITSATQYGHASIYVTLCYLYPGDGKLTNFGDTEYNDTKYGHDYFNFGFRHFLHKDRTKESNENTQFAELGYMNNHFTNSRAAKRMVKTLNYFEKKLVQLESDFGRADDIYTLIRYLMKIVNAERFAINMSAVYHKDNGSLEYRVGKLISDASMNN